MNIRMMKAVASVVLSALVAGCTAIHGPCDGAKSAIRVGTYNIRYSNGDAGTPNAWQQRKDDLVALVKRLDLDIAGLQEVCPDQLSYLRGKMPGFEFVGEHRNADRTTGEASPVMYRKDRFDAEKAGTFWLSETPDVPGVKGWGAACPRVCSYAVLRDRRTGRRLCFANTHTDHRSAEAREKGMQLIIERMREFGNGCPIVFTGDHNCRETEDPAIAVSKLLNNALYESKTPPSGSWRTFNGWQWRDEEFSTAEALKLDKSVRNARTGSPDGERLPNGMHAWELCGARIDYVYVSPGVRVLDYATVSAPRSEGGLYPSDHFPIVATIEVPGEAD